MALAPLIYGRNMLLFEHIRLFNLSWTLEVAMPILGMIACKNKMAKLCGRAAIACNDG